MPRFQKDIPMFSENSLKKREKASNETVVIKRKVSTIYPGSTKSNLTKKDLSLLKAIASKNNTTRFLLVLTITAIGWLSYKNNKLEKIVKNQVIKIQAQEERIIKLKSFEKELKKLQKQIISLDNRQLKTQKVALRNNALHKYSKNITKPFTTSPFNKEINKDIEKLISENSKLLSMNQEMIEDIKLVKLKNKKLVEKYDQMINFFDPNCNLKKCLKFKEKQDVITENHDKRLQDAIDSHHQSKDKFEKTNGANSGDKTRAPASVTSLSNEQWNQK